jgi:hypothetical protein
MIQDYRMDALRVNFGCQAVSLNAFESRGKALADGIEESLASGVITDVDDHVWCRQAIMYKFGDFFKSLRIFFDLGLQKSALVI